MPRPPNLSRQRSPSHRDAGALRGDGVGVLVVEPDAALAEVAELDALSLRDGDGHAAGAVAAADQLVGAGRPVVERADGRDRAVEDVVGQHELDLGAGAVRGDAQGHAVWSLRY